MAVNEALKGFLNSDQNKLELTQYFVSIKYILVSIYYYYKTATNVFWVNGSWGIFGFIPFKWDGQNYYAQGTTIRKHSYNVQIIIIS